MRNGEFIKSGKLSEITQEEVTGLMVGEKFSHQEVYQKRELGENVLELNGLSGHGFSNVNLTVKKAVIVGLTDCRDQEAANCFRDFSEQYR